MVNPPAAEPNEPLVRVLARGLRILKAFEPRNPWLSNQDITALTALPKPTVSRITASLTTMGYLSYSHPRGRYRLAPATLTLGYLALANIGLRATARPLMQKLANEADALVVLAEHEGMAMVCSEVCHSENSIVSLRVHRGSRLSLPISAVGRAHLGALSAAERDAIGREIAERYPAKWPSLREDIARAAGEIAERGFCVTLESLERGINGVAVSLDLANAPHRYVLGCAAPGFHFPRERLEREIGPALLAIKRDIERRLAPAPARMAH